MDEVANELELGAERPTVTIWGGAPEREFRECQLG